MAKLKIMINPSNQVNNVDVYGVPESTNAHELGNLIKSKILASNYGSAIDVVITPFDANDNLSNVISYENSYKPTLFASLHLNGFNGSAYGTETWYYKGDEKGKNLAIKTSSDLATTIGTVNRGAKDSSTAPNGGLMVVDKTLATSILIELCFMDNKADVDKYRAKKDNVANVIAWRLIEHLINYHGLIKIVDNTTKTSKQELINAVGVINAEMKKLNGLIINI